MNCAAFKELAALYALGALDGEERAACEAHLASGVAHEGCPAVLAEALANVARLEAQQPTETPSPEVWAAIERRIAPDVRNAAPPVAPRRRRSTYVAWGVAAASAAAFLWMLRERGQIIQSRNDAVSGATQKLTAVSTALDACRVQVQHLEDEDRLRREAVALLQLPGTQLFPLVADAVGKQPSTMAANAILHTGVKRAYVVTQGLVPVHEHDYQLWVVKGTKVLSAGLIAVDHEGRAVVKVDYDAILGTLGAPDKLVVTLEPTGGSAVARGPAVLVGGPKS